MLKSIQLLIHPIAERLIAVIATSLSSTVQTLHALGQAEQQNQIEEAARRYEKEGKPEIAATLRRRAGELTSTNPLADGVDIITNVSSMPAESLPPAKATTGGNLTQLPRLDRCPPRPRRKRTTGQPPKSTDG